ncbi:MAG: RNA polymerase sigma factor [Acidobacteriota bacterium]
MFPDGVTSGQAATNDRQMEIIAQEAVLPLGVSEDGVALGRVAADRVATNLDLWMERYQHADPEAPSALIAALSPALLRFFRAQLATREQAEDLLQETWMRIHRVRHTYRPKEPVLPWVYAIARRVRVDGYRRVRRVTLHETTVETLPDRPSPAEPKNSLPSFHTLVAALPESQREVLTMLKVGGLSLEEVARATSSTVGAVKQKAHRAYERLRTLLESRTGETTEEL